MDEKQVSLNLISEKTEIIGEVKAKNDLRVDGVVKGKVNSQGRVIIGQTARIEGDIQSPNVELMGEVQGNVISSGSVTLRAKSIVNGSIAAATISIEMGAIFNGKCQIQRDAQKPPVVVDPATLKK